MNVTVHDTTYQITTEADLFRLLFALRILQALATVKALRFERHCSRFNVLREALKPEIVGGDGEEEPASRCACINSPMRRSARMRISAASDTDVREIGDRR